MLVDIVKAAARAQPGLMLFEDAHWADPTTLEVLGLGSTSGSVLMLVDIEEMDDMVVHVIAPADVDLGTLGVDGHGDPVERRAVVMKGAHQGVQCLSKIAVSSRPKVWASRPSMRCRGMKSTSLPSLKSAIEGLDGG